MAACMPAAYECTDLIGCVDILPGEPIHIAFNLVIDGPDATMGIDARNGAEIAISEAGGELLGHPIEFDGDNDACSAEGGLKSGTKLAADPTIVAVLGSLCSSAAQVSAPILSNAGYTILSLSSIPTELTQSGNENNWPGFLQIAPSDSIRGAAAARFAWEKLGVKKAAMIQDGSLDAQQLQQAFADEFRRLGGKIVAQGSIDPAQTDLTSVLNTISPTQPEFIYLPIFIQAGSQIVKQARETPGLGNVYLMGADSMYSPEVVERAGDAAEGLFISGPDMSSFDESYQTQFIPKYKELFGSDPIGISHAEAYDAMNLILAAIRKVAIVDPDGTLHIGRQALRDALYGTQNFKGLTGNLTCNPADNCAEPKIVVYAYHAGEFPPERVWP